MRNRNKNKYSVLRGNQLVFSYDLDGAVDDCEFDFKGKKDLIQKVRKWLIKGEVDYVYILNSEPTKERKDIKYVRKTRKALKIMKELGLFAGCYGGHHEKVSIICRLTEYNVEEATTEDLYRELDKCELNCLNYYSCDKVFEMNMKLSKEENQ